MTAKTVVDVIFRLLWRGFWRKASKSGRQQNAKSGFGFNAVLFFVVAFLGLPYMGIAGDYWLLWLAGWIFLSGYFGYAAIKDMFAAA